MKLKKIFKNFASILLVFTMLMSILPVGVFSAETNQVTIKFGAYDGVGGNFIFTPQELEVPVGIASEYGLYNAEPGHIVGGVDHGVEDGEVTALDALVAAHIQASGDISGIVGSESYIMGMFGIQGNIGFSINGKMPVGEMSDGYAINEYVLKDGETILFFSYADEDMWGDYTSYFDVQSKNVQVNEEFELTLNAYQAMETMWYEPGSETPETMTLTAVPYAEICVVDEYGGLMPIGKYTDEDGKVSMACFEEGEYIIAAKGTVTDLYGMEASIVPALCFVTVGGEVDSEPESEPVPANRLMIGVTTDKGSLNYVEFKNASGGPIENAELSINDKSINVVLPKEYDVSGKVTAEFSLTQNKDYYPFITPNKSFNRAYKNKTNTYTATLERGKSTKEVYFYNIEPSARNNVYDTYTINYKVKNEIPTLAENISATDTAETTAGTPYTVNLNEIFADVDGDVLSYKVKINAENVVNADANYSFTPELGGEYTLVFTADDGKDVSTDTYTVFLTVANSTDTFDISALIPEGITPAFYITNGYENNIDILGDELVCESGETEKGFVSYTVKVPANIDAISIRAKKGDVSLGGMSIPVSENTSVAFREIRGFLPTQVSGNYVTAHQAVMEVKDKYGNYATVGVEGTDEDGILYYTFFLAATGNERLYTFYAKPLGDISSVYALTQADNKAISAESADIYETSVELSYKSAFKLNVPADAEAKAFYQNKNYNVSELTPLEIKDEADGTKTYYFHVASGSTAYSYRVSKEGKITKAGYISGNEQKVTWDDEDYAPDSKIDYDKTTLYGSRGDDSLLLNVNGQQRLILTKDETFKLRAYRIWQIINNDTDNRMIEPDFTYNILSGADIISVEPVTSDNGNAKNNWLNITATGEGVAILEIGYNALDIISGNVSIFNGLSQFTFGACDEARKGLVVIQTVNAATDVDFGIKDKSSWDAEFDTVYFTGEYTTIAFMPTVTEGAISKIEFSNDKGENWTKIDKKDDVYTARIISGNNILKVTKDDGTTSYQVVRGDKITTSITNITNPGENLSAGDTARVTLDGIHFPMGKMSGIYNPGYGYGHKLTYTLGETQVQTEGTFQYNFPANAYIDITIPSDAESGDSFTLTDGYIYFNNMGSAPGEHRNITDDGVSTNMNASSSHYSRSILPEITITLKTEESGGGDSGDDSGDDEGGSSDESGDDTTRPDGSIDTSDLNFDISENEIKGYVTVSFTDDGKRKSGETGVVYKNALGEIIKKVEVPFKSRDTIATVTLRLLEALDIKASYTGSATSNFYLSSIGNFTLNGTHYSSFGEFDAGAASGWMIKHNNWFINMGASEFAVQDGDKVEWLYTCQLGADIGCDWSNPSAEITGINFKSNYGTLSPSFNKDVTEYTYSVSSSTKSICLEVKQANYWAKVTYKSGDKIYKAMESIPVSDGTIITIESTFAEYAGDTPSDTDKITITIKKSSDGGGAGGSGSNSSKTDDLKTDDENVNKDEQINENETVQTPEFIETTFDDVKKDDWYYESVKYVYENNLMQGTGNAFEPESKMTRAMLVTVLYRMANPAGTKNTHSFKDIPDGQWYSDAVAWAAENGIVSGVSEIKFAPDEDVTREQMALIIYRYAKMKGFDVSGVSNLEKFTDSGNVSDWALEAIKWANYVTLVNGTSETTLSPKDTATRAQVASILMRFCETLAK